MKTKRAYKDKDYLVQHFKRNKESVAQIAKHFKVNPTTIQYFLLKYGIRKIKFKRTKVA